MSERTRSFVASAALVVGSFGASSLIMLAVASALHAASGERWLRNSPHASAVAERCGAPAPNAKRDTGACATR